MTTRDAALQASIIIVNYNGGRFLAECLASVAREAEGRAEVIVVDNGSTDGSADIPARVLPWARLVRNSANLGFAEANNQGVQLATSDVIVLLNNDTIVRPGWLDGLLQMLSEPDVAVVTSRVETEGVPAEFYAMNGTINYLGYNIMRVFQDLSVVFYAGGASLAFTKHAVGLPFRAEYFLYHEDVYLSWRMRLRGGAIRMAQASVVQHLGSATTARQPSAFVTFYQERNRMLNILLFFQRRTIGVLLPLLAADILAKSTAAVLGKGKSFAGLLRAYGWILSHPGWIRRARKDVQGERKVGDEEILRWMSPKLLQGPGSLAAVVNGVATAYARICGLAFYE